MGATDGQALSLAVLRSWHLSGWVKSMFASLFSVCFVFVFVFCGIEV